MVGQFTRLYMLAGVFSAPLLSYAIADMRHHDDHVHSYSAPGAVQSGLDSGYVVPGP